MKKKIAVLFLASVLALSATACSSGSSETSSTASEAGTSSSASDTTESTAESAEESAEESTEESTAASEDVTEELADELMKSFIDTISGESLYMKVSYDTSSLSSLMSSESSDIPETLEMVFAYDKDNEKMYMDFGYSLLGFQKMMYTDGKKWMLDDTNKLAYYTESSDTTSLTDSLSGSTGMTLSADSFENMTFVSGSVTEFNGEECYAVVYSQSDVSTASGVTVSSSESLTTESTYYFKTSDKSMAGFESSGSEMILEEISSEIPDGLFDVPSDYTQMDMASMYSTTSESE